MNRAMLYSNLAMSFQPFPLQWLGRSLKAPVVHPIPGFCANRILGHIEEWVWGVRVFWIFSWDFPVSKSFKTLETLGFAMGMGKAKPTKEKLLTCWMLSFVTCCRKWQMSYFVASIWFQKGVFLELSNPSHFYSMISILYMALRFGRLWKLQVLGKLPSEMLLFGPMVGAFLPLMLSGFSLFVLIFDYNVTTFERELLFHQTQRGHVFFIITTQLEILKKTKADSLASLFEFEIETCGGQVMSLRWPTYRLQYLRQSYITLSHKQHAKPLFLLCLCSDCGWKVHAPQNKNKTQSLTFWTPGLFNEIRFSVQHIFSWVRDEVETKTSNCNKC